MTQNLWNPTRQASISAVRGNALRWAAVSVNNGTENQIEDRRQTHASIGHRVATGGDGRSEMPHGIDAPLTQRWDMKPYCALAPSIDIARARQC